MLLGCGGVGPWRVGRALGRGGVRSAPPWRVGRARSAVISASLSALPERLPKLSYVSVFSPKDFKVGEAGGQCCRS